MSHIETTDEMLKAFGEWRARNFDAIAPGNLLLGVAEEFGELCKASRDEMLGKPSTDTKDAIGDTVLYLAAYCRERGWAVRECVELAWSQVRERDYRRWPLTGRAP